MMGYWEERQEEMYTAGEMKVNQYFIKLEKAFNQTKRELQKAIDAFYFRYAEENGLSFAAAQKNLDAEELGEVQDFIDLVMQNIGRYNQQVNNLSLKARISRYQALEAQVDAMLRQLYAINYQAEAEQTMQEVYEDTYYRTWYNTDQYHGYHSEFAQINPGAVQALLEYPFNGAAFSSRLWKQKDHLQAQLMEAVTTMLIQGRHPSTLAKDFAKKMNSKKFDAYRLLHTESSFIASQATHAGYKEDGVEKYEILATLDSKTCGVCGELDNQVYEVGKEIVGVNMPPFHPLCRCTTAPHYDDTPTEGLTRVARNVDGNSVEVTEDMSYSEWKKVVDEGGDFASWKKPEKPDDSENQKRYAARREEWKKRQAAETEPKTTADVSRIGTKKLVEAYESKRTANGLKLMPANTFMDKSPDIVKADYGDIDFKSAKGFNDTISELIEEYDTPLQRIVTMEKEEAFFQKTVPAHTSVDYNFYSAEMRINQNILRDNDAYVERVKKAIKKGQFPDIPDELAEKYVPTHEFAHTLLATKSSMSEKKNWTGMDFKNHRKARTEVKKLYQSYIDDMEQLKTEKDSLYKKFFDGSITEGEAAQLRKIEADIKKLKISNYAEKDVDEFLAEAFTDAKLGKEPSEYSKRVLKVIDQNFKKSIEKDADFDIINLGAVSGALTDKNDPWYIKREKHASMYYESIRNSKKEPIVKTISRNSGFSESYISKVYDHVFTNEYELNGRRQHFAPDYDMAESFRRLREGRSIQEHDVILLKHEHLEYGLMNRLGLSYEDAHNLAQTKYSYKDALDAFKEKNHL